MMMISPRGRLWALMALVVLTSCRGPGAPADAAGPISLEADTILIAPASVETSPGDTVCFSVHLSQTSDTVVWSSRGGTIAPDGCYTAGAAPGLYEVIATTSLGAADTAFVTITLPPRVVSVEISLKEVELEPGAVFQFTARSIDDRGAASIQRVAWYTDGGTIDDGGQYTVPDEAGDQIVVAVSADGPADTAGVRVSGISLIGDR